MVLPGNSIDVSAFFYREHVSIQVKRVSIWSLDDGTNYNNLDLNGCCFYHAEFQLTVACGPSSVNTTLLDDVRIADKNIFYQFLQKKNIFYRFLT